MLPEPMLKASPPVKGCPLLALAVLATLAGVIALGFVAVRAVIS